MMLMLVSAGPNRWFQLGTLQSWQKNKPINQHNTGTLASHPPCSRFISAGGTVHVFSPW